MRLEVRGIGPAIIRGYLLDLGARETETDTLAGQGWTATVEAGDPIPIGALRIGRTIVTFAGDEATVRRIAAALQRKTFRAGG